jgi:3-dehydroquinate synthetase
VLADPTLLATLPEPELRSGLAEAMKNGVIGDPNLFDLCSQGWRCGQTDESSSGMAVKIETSRQIRMKRTAAMNGIRWVTPSYSISKRATAAVGIGMVAAASLAERSPGRSRAGGQNPQRRPVSACR